MATGVETALAEGADIINISYGWDQNCHRTFDQGGLNSALTAVTNAGVLVVAAAGNEGYSAGHCSVHWPAGFRDVLSVAGVNSLSHTVSRADYGSTGKASQSSAGGRSVQVSGGSVLMAPFVDVASHFHLSRLFTGGTNGYSSGSTSINGTSLSAPIVASIAVLTREWMSELGWQLADSAWGVGINLLLLGDGRHDGSTVYRNEVSEILGFGAIRYSWPDSSQLGSTWGWSTRREHIYNGHFLGFSVNSLNPLPYNVNGYKLALRIDHNSWYSLPDLEVSVYDTCSSSGGGGLLGPLIAQANDHAGVAKIHLENSEVRGRCLYVVIEGEAVRSQGFPVYIADYYYSNDPSYNDPSYHVGQ